MIATAFPPPIIELRDYQREAVEAVRARWLEGRSRQLVAIPTGGGKTIIAGYLARELALPKQWSTVMLVHRVELVRQSVEKFGLVLPGVGIGVVAADRDELGFPITVASVQTLLQPRRLARLQASLMSSRLVISDEAHHDAAPGRQGVIDALAATLKVGFTATPERADNKGLSGYYETVAYSISMLRLMAQSRLAPLAGLRIGTGTSLEGVHTRAGDFAERELAVICDSAERNDLIVRTWLRHAADRSRTVAFCVDVAHAEHLRDAFLAAGVHAETVVGSTPEGERHDRLERFGRGQVPVLTSCMVLTEGYDEPGIDCILHARPTQSRPLYIQMTGRGARNAPGKENCLVIDFVDNSRRFAIVSLDQLADGDESALLGRGRCDKQAKPRDGETYDLLERARGERRASVRAGQDDALLYERSPLHWREVSGVKMARIASKQYAVLQPTGDGRFHVVHLDTQDWTGAVAHKVTPASLDLGYSMGICEDMADKQLRTNPGNAGLARRDAPFWGKTQPPTDKQVELAVKMRIPFSEATTRQELALLIDDKFFEIDWRRWQRTGAQFS